MLSIHFLYPKFNWQRRGNRTELGSIASNRILEKNEFGAVLNSISHNLSPVKSSKSRNSILNVKNLFSFVFKIHTYKGIKLKTPFLLGSDLM